MRFYCKQLQNDGALNFVHLFLDHSVELMYTSTWPLYLKSVYPMLLSSEQILEPPLAILGPG